MIKNQLYQVCIKSNSNNMKKTIQLLFLSLLTSSICFAQGFQGKAVYKSVRQMNFNMSTEGMDPAMAQRLQEQLKKQMERDYELVFDQYSSIYKEQEQLEANAPQQGGMMIMTFGGDEDAVLYKNTRDNRYTSARDVFGKEFLVKDALEHPEWVMTKETKQIGEYTCYKATYEREQQNMTRIRVDNDDDNTVEEASTEMITVEAWYTPDIPVAHGPSLYGGLPGLIMEVKDGNVTTICSQIVLNPKEKIAIEEPTKGKVLTEEAFETLMTEKMQEMEKMNKGGKRKGQGHSVEITIEG